MFITPHTSAALWISTRVTDPLLAFFFGVVSHFMLDMIPHGDEQLADHKKGKREKLVYLMKVAFVDTALAVLLIYFFISYGPEVNHYVLFSAVFGTWLPDLAWIVIEYFKLNSMYWYIVFHGKLHNLFDWQYSIVYGVPFQMVVTMAILKGSI